MNSLDNRKLLFAHDGPLYKDSGGRYYGLHYNNQLIERYTVLASRINFLTRVENISDNPDGKFSLLDHSALQVINFPNLKTLKSRLFSSASASEVAKAAVKESDIGIARLPSSSGSLAVKFALLYNKPLLVEFVACGWDAYWNYNWKGKLVAPYFYFKQRMRMRKVPYVIYVTERFLQKRYPTKGKSLALSDVALPGSDFSVDERIARIRRRENDTPLILGTVAALNVPYKGQADVIKAVAVLKKRGISVIYKLVGQGDDSSLRKLIKQLGLENEVTILGALPHDKVFNYLDKIDVYIQPSKQEGLPRAVIEAMSRGCAVIGSNVGGIPELIDERFVFKAGKVDDIVRKIEMINPEVLSEYARFSIGVASRYSSKALEIKRQAFYSSFLRENNLAR